MSEDHIPLEDIASVGDWFIEELIARLSPGKSFKEIRLERIFGDEPTKSVGCSVADFMTLPAMIEFEDAMDKVGDIWYCDHDGDEQEPSSRDLEGRTVLYRGYRECEYNGMPILIRTYDYGPNDHRFDFVCKTSDVDALEELRALIWARIDNFEWFKGKTVHYTGILEVLTPNEGLSFDEVILDEAEKKSIVDNTIRYLEEREKLRAAGVEVRRGLLLSGPPGNGKSKTCRTIASNVPEGTTVVWLTGSSIRNSSDVKIVFDIARKLSPTLLIIEDIDSIGGNRDSAFSTPPNLGELLSQMDGIGGSDGIITIATTNYADKVDAALKDRPRRFDRHFVLPPLDNRARVALLEKHTTDIDKDDLRLIAKKLEGRSGAVVEEVVHTARVHALREDVEMTIDHLRLAVEELSLYDPNNMSSPEVI